MADSFADLQRKLVAVERDLEGRGARASMGRVGRDLRPEIDRAVVGTLGDKSMSGWKRGGPIQITGTSRLLDDQSVLVEPVKRSKGPMAVLERGRNLGGGGGFAGPGINSRTGVTSFTKSGAVRKVRARAGKRWNGYTQGKGTMTDASEAIQKRAPGLIADEVHKTLAKHLRGG